MILLKTDYQFLKVSLTTKKCYTNICKLPQIINVVFHICGRVLILGLSILNFELTLLYGRFQFVELASNQK